MGAILSGFITYIGWGTGDIFGATAARKVGAATTTLWTILIGMALLSFYIPWALADFQRVTPSITCLSLFLGSLFILGNILINEALILSSVSLIGAILSLIPILTLVFSLIFFNDTVSITRWVVIGIVLFGVFLCTVNVDDLKNGKGIRDKGVILSVISIMMIAIYFTALRVPMEKVGWFWPVYIGYFSFPIFFVYARFRKMSFGSPFKKNAFLPIALSAISLRTAEISFNIGLNSFGSTVIAPIAGAYPSLFLILSFLFFHDPLKIQQKIGIIITISGVVFSLLPLFTG
ncbi:DMT family transporter [Candidatus Gottesmanbacteria bacterium]|nr:DMT family transporter [Candidatus Gottesmanbacteria bacterium]